MVRDKVIRRSGGQCEAMVEVRPEIWSRCGRRPVEDHHLLTRARGGDLLDSAGEIYHHMALCRQHHNDAHSGGARSEGLLMDGYAYFDSATRLIIYSGPDLYLRKMYGHPRSVSVPTLREDLPGPVDGEIPRGEDL